MKIYIFLGSFFDFNCDISSSVCKKMKKKCYHKGQAQVDLCPKGEQETSH